MGTIEEENLVQMVNDFIELETSAPIFSVLTNSRPLNDQTKYSTTLQEILKRRSIGESEVHEDVTKHMRNKMDADKTSCLKKWLVKCLKRDGHLASLCRTSWVTAFGPGQYEYIDVIMQEDDGVSVRLIIDIDFKSQFELARPTPTYAELTNTLPSIFVGDENKLSRIVSLLCSAAEQSLRERGLHIPPWRRTGYMHSKWLSHCHKAPSATSIGSTKCIRDSSNKFSKWAPPKVKPKGKSLGGGSGLTSQFSNMGINCR